MKSRTELEQDIINITNLVELEFPGLPEKMMKKPIQGTGDEAVYIKDLEGYYQSIVSLIQHYEETHSDSTTGNKVGKSAFPGYPLYPESDDIYSQGKKEMDLDPEDPSKKKAPNEAEGTSNEKDFRQDKSGDDLDVPGSELDDQQESVGSEDEENNYYSLGGDDHNDLEEDKG